MLDKVDFQLPEPLKYGLNGQEMEAAFIEVRCPNLKDKKDVAYHRTLKGFIARSMLKLNAETGEKKSDEDPREVDQAEKLANGEEIDARSGMDGAQMAMLLCAYGGDEYNGQVDAFARVCQKYCFLDGETPLESGPRERLDSDLFENLFGTFCANFTMPSLMKTMSGKK